MSFSLSVPCKGCKKEDVCTDGVMFQLAQNAVNASDYFSPERQRHFGRGHVEVSCARKAEYAEGEETKTE